MVYPMEVEGELEFDDFADSKVSTQIGFTRKGLGIVAAQMTLSFAVVIMASYSPAFGAFCQSIPVLILALIVLVGTMIALMCSERLRT